MNKFKSMVKKSFDFVKKSFAVVLSALMMVFVSPILTVKAVKPGDQLLQDFDIREKKQLLAEIPAIWHKFEMSRWIAYKLAKSFDENAKLACLTAVSRSRSTVFVAARVVTRHRDMFAFSNAINAACQAASDAGQSASKSCVAKLLGMDPKTVSEATFTRTFSDFWRKGGRLYDCAIYADRDEIFNLLNVLREEINKLDVTVRDLKCRQHI